MEDDEKIRGCFLKQFPIQIFSRLRLLKRYFVVIAKLTRRNFQGLGNQISSTNG
jgi:hypothetical protein